MVEHTPEERAFVEEQIASGRFSPAARTMPVDEVIDQYNEANALEPGDPDFMVHPDLVETTIVTEGGEIPGYALRSNPNAKVSRQNVGLARGTDRISRHLGSSLGL